MMGRAMRRLYRAAYWLLDLPYHRIEKSFYTRNASLLRVPRLRYRRGGTVTLTEWGHSIGMFQTLIHANLPRRQQPRTLLDFGSGCGRLAIAAAPGMRPDDRYIGLDVSEEDFRYCERAFRDGRFEFHLLDAFNATYNPKGTQKRSRWPLDDASVDLLTALSVWTHLSETDARFYLAESARVLRTEGRAIVTAFILDESYRENLHKKTPRTSQYYPQAGEQWIFDQPAYGSKDWRCPKWVAQPEDAIGITEDALMRLIEEVGLRVREHIPGYWRDAPGLHFQDILILEKR